ncbi:PAS domain-containing protein [Desulfobacula sp.]|uniref:PAS domain-containing protein n=1 Tax=Desulfobacula sp. TaxID=2593537 RepID=UPI00262414CE|nr:PAS domain-containing protein [Desulfobacula sp.]
MENPKSIFDLFDHDDNYKFIMKRLLEQSMEESFNSIIITEASKGYPIVYVNPAFCEMTGYGPHEVLGKSPSMLQGKETDPAVIKQLNEDIRAGRLFHGRALNYRRDGSEFMMEWKIVPINGKNDRISHYLAIQKDVTD